MHHYLHVGRYLYPLRVESVRAFQLTSSPRLPPPRSHTYHIQPPPKKRNQEELCTWGIKDPKRLASLDFLLNLHSLSLRMRAYVHACMVGWLVAYVRACMHARVYARAR